MSDQRSQGHPDVNGQTTTSRDVATCDACRRPLENALYCSACRSLQPIDGLDYFAMLGLPRSFDVDATDVRRRYLAIARTIHPDRFSAGSPEAAGRSMQASATLNRAAEVLSDAFLRADYLLELAGGPSAADERTVPPEVLGDALMLRADLDEARSDGNAAAVAGLASQVREKLAASIEQISTAARALPGDELKRTALRVALNAARYYQKLLEQTA